MRSRGGPRALNLISAFLLGQIGAHMQGAKKKSQGRAGPGRAPTSFVVVCYVISLAYVLIGVLPGLLGQCISVTYWQGERWTTWPETHGPRRVALAQGLGKASSFISGRAREKAHGKHSWICVETSLLARAENTIIFFKCRQYKEYYGTSRLGQLSCDVGLTIQHVFKLRVVPHFSSGI